MIKKASFNFKDVFICTAVAALFIFTNIDKKVCEIFLVNRKINVDIENVILVNGINSLESELSGSREKMAESILMLNEFGADKIIFDFDLSKNSTDNLFFDADAYLQNCLKVRKNIFTFSEISKGAGLGIDYKNISRLDAAVIESVKEKLDESSSIDCDVFYEIKTSEINLVKYLSEMEDSGYFEYTPEYNSPYTSYVDFVRKKEILFEKLDAAEVEKKKVFEEYVDAKKHFVDTIKMFINGSASELLSEIAEDRSETYGNIDERFSELRELFDVYITQRDEIKSKVSEATCVFAPDDTVYNIAAVLFCVKSFVKTLWWWVGVLIALMLCFGCDFLCAFVKSFEQKVCVCLCFIYFSILISYVIFIKTGVYVGFAVPFSACLLLMICEILIFKYGKVFKQLNNQSVNASKSMAVVVFSVEKYEEIVKDFNSEEESLVLFNQYYELIEKTAEIFGGTKRLCENGKLVIEFRDAEDLDISVEICKAVLKIKSIILKLNHKLIKKNILEKAISIGVHVEMVI